MTAEEFIASIPEALTPEALSRAVDASARRKPGVTAIDADQRRKSWRSPADVRTSWTSARADAKRAVLADQDLNTAGTDAVWAAVSAAMDAAAAYAVQKYISSDDFSALLAPWSYMTEGETA